MFGILLQFSELKGKPGQRQTIEVRQSISKYIKVLISDARRPRVSAHSQSEELPTSRQEKLLLFGDVGHLEIAKYVVESHVLDIQSTLVIFCLNPSLRTDKYEDRRLQAWRSLREVLGIQQAAHPALPPVAGAGDGSEPEKEPAAS